MMSRNASLQFSSGPPGTPMNIRFHDITSTSFVVQWDEVDDADHYIVNWRDDGGSVRESTRLLASITITQLSPNTTYSVTVTAGNICGSGTVSDILIVTTDVTLLVGPSISSSVRITTYTRMLSSLVAMATPATIMSSSMVATLTPLTTPTFAGSPSSSNDSPVILIVIFPVIAVITVVGIAVLILVIIVVKKKANSSAQQTLTVPLYETIDEPPVSKNELKNPTYSTPCDKDPITSTDKVLYEPVSSPSYTANDIELQQNPAYATSDKVIMDDNPAYKALK
ncbi:mucin-17-like isoform X2 [Dysidea avara]|uniref:mucin-17-like isoform X2 n=1 Tax=Dysidea avara TaxID=196820 RepID=UPI00331EE326